MGSLNVYPIAGDESNRGVKQKNGITGNISHAEASREIEMGRKLPIHLIIRMLYKNMSIPGSLMYYFCLTVVEEVQN